MPAQSKPNILFIMADDIGWFNVSCYNHGIMGYETPNIDRIAKEGAMLRISMGSRVAPLDMPPLLPASRHPYRPDQGRHAWRDARTQRRRSFCWKVHEAFRLCHGAVRKNHLGDRNEHLPTVH